MKAFCDAMYHQLLEESSCDDEHNNNNKNGVHTANLSLSVNEYVSTGDKSKNEEAVESSKKKEDEVQSN